LLPLAHNNNIIELYVLSCMYNRVIYRVYKKIVCSKMVYYTPTTHINAKLRGKIFVLINN